MESFHRRLFIMTFIVNNMEYIPTTLSVNKTKRKTLIPRRIGIAALRKDKYSSRT